MPAILSILLYVLITFILAAFAGLGAALIRIALFSGNSKNVFTRGPWKSFSLIQLKDFQFEKAVKSIYSFLAPGKDESLQFVALADSHGQALNGSRTYEISGKSFDAAYWSFTVYGENSSFIPNDAEIFCINGKSGALDKKGNFCFVLSPDSKPGSWLPSGGRGKLKLYLRLYAPSNALSKNISSLQLPEIKCVKSA